MKLMTFGKIVGAVALTAMLSGCFDITMDVAVQSETGGKATVTTTMAADVYGMMKQGANGSSSDSSNDFCKETDSTLTENADGSATCVQTKEGTFEELDLKADEGAAFTVVSPGVVRAAFDTTKMKGDLANSTGTTDSMDEETKAMVTAMFANHTMTIRISGKKITDTNMTLAADGMSAEQVIPLLDMMNGTATLPPELYAVVDTN